jgi:hypothetical protein
MDNGQLTMDNGHYIGASLSAAATALADLCLGRRIGKFER